MGTLINEMTPTQRAIMEGLEGFKDSLQPTGESTKQVEELFGSEEDKIVGDSFTSVTCTTTPRKSPNIPVQVFAAGYWPENMQKHIPEVNPLYKPDKEALYSLFVAWYMNEPCMIYGPTGSGKTSLVEYACAITNRPYIRINGRGDMESGPIFGQPSVEIDKDTQLSVYKWNDGIVTEGIKSGAVVLFDEPFATPPEIQIGLNSLLEDDGFLVLSDKAGSYEDKIVHPHEDFRMVYCDNTGGMGDMTGAHAGINVQNTSTLDRFQTVIHLDYMTKRNEVKMLQAKVPDLPDVLVNSMVQFAQLVRSNYVQGD